MATKIIRVTFDDDLDYDAFAHEVCKAADDAAAKLQSEGRLNDEVYVSWADDPEDEVAR